MEKHKKYLDNYKEGFEKLSIELGDLRYDSLSEFLNLLSKKLDKDSLADKDRNREKLSYELLEASKRLKEASENTDKAWIICKPYMNV